MNRFRMRVKFSKKVTQSLIVITFLSFSLTLISNFFQISSSNLQNLDHIDENRENSSSASEKLFTGTEAALNITDYGKLYKSNQKISVNEAQEENLTYYLDDQHDWKVSKIENNISNIQDTRDWVEDGNFQSVNCTVINMSYSLDTFPHYGNSEDKSSSLHNITKVGAKAMRVYFESSNFEEDFDFICLEDGDNNLCFRDSGIRSQFYSPWVRGDTIQIYIISDGTITEAGYEISSYQYINETVDLDIWGNHSNAKSQTYYGYGFAENNVGMYVSLISDLWYSGGVDGYYANYSKYDYAEIYQNLTIPRGKVIDAYLNFNYLAEFALESNDFYIFAKINGQEIYSIGFGDIVDANRNQWHSSGNIYMDLWVNNSNIFDNTINDQSLNISVGLKSRSAAYYQGFQDRYQQNAWFNNLTLVLTTIANASQSDISLKINSKELNQENVWGKAKLNITNIWNVNPILINVTTVSPSLSFELDTILYGFHNSKSRIEQSTSEGISYEILQNGTIYWKFSHNFYMPAQYSDFEFIISKPRNWSFISALDPTLQNRAYEYGNMGDIFLQIDKENALYPGWWTFKATSPNFLNLTNTKLVGGIDSTFFTGESTIIRSQVNYSNQIPSNVDETSVNLTIFNPDGNKWFSESKTPLSNGTVFFSELYFDAFNTTGGEYEYTLFWSNGTALGGLNSSLFVVHDSSLSLLKPNDAISDLITDAFVGDIIPVRIKFFDSENNDSISNAIISYNWTTGTIDLEEAALGIYETILDTSDLGSNGFYEILIQTSKVGFESYNLTLKINLGEETRLQRLESDYNIELHANSTIKFKYYSMVNETGINGALVKVNISNPELHFIRNYGDGLYDIQFNTSFINNLGIYELKFNFTAPSYEPQTHIYQFRIVEQSINITTYINNQNIDENSIIEVDYMELLNVSTQAKAIIDNEFLSGGNFTWTTDSYQQSLNELGSFWYNGSIIINPSKYSTGLNLIEIRFEMNKYQMESFYFQLLVNEQPVELSVYINSHAISENEIIETMYKENLTVSVRAYATLEMDYIAGASITWQGGNQYQSLIEASLWYNLSIQIVSSNYTPGLNSIAIQFIKNDYQTEVFSFQFLVHEQSIELSAYINSQAISENEIIETMYMETLMVSVRAYATVEMEYIPGASMNWQGGNQDQSLIEVGLWYNLSIQIVPVNYTSGLNSVTIQFTKDDYQTEVFSFQLLVNKQSVELSSYANSKEIFDNELIEVMFKQTISFSLRAYGTVDLNYISGAQVHWDSQFYSKDFIENGDWYNLSLTFTASNFSSGINSVSIKFEKENYTTIYFSFQLLLREQSVVLNASINDQSIPSEGALIEVMFKENISISAQAKALGEGIFLSGGNISLSSISFHSDFEEIMPTWFTINFIIDGAYFKLGINTVSIKFEQENYTISYLSFQFYITADNVNLSLYTGSNEILSNSLIQVTYYDEISLSLRAMANAEKIYLNGGTATLTTGNFSQEFTEYEDFYNITLKCVPDNFKLFENKVFISFTHPNYTSSKFNILVYVNQIQMNAKTIDFQDSIEGYSGDSVLIRINLTELVTTHMIENATIRYSWEYGLGNLEYVGSGIYETTLTLPENVRGSYKVSLIILTDNILYKVMQTSFIVVISQHELPNYMLWIIITGATIAIGVLGALSLRSYIILPRRRKKEAELLSKTQNFKDLRNIQAIVLMHRYSGVPLYSKSYSILEKQKKELFAGFVQAITSIGEEIAGKRSDEGENKAKTVQNLFELDFKFFHCLICDRDDLRIVVVLTDKASENLKNDITNLAAGITLNLNDLIEHWDGALETFENEIPPILKQYLDLYYKEPFILNSVEYISKLRKEVELTKMEVRVLNTVYSMAKSKQSFLLDYIIETVHEENKDVIIEAIESLISNKVFLPTSK
jgi:hypothetical protein